MIEGAHKEDFSMYIQNTTLQRLYRLGFVLVCQTGIVLQYAIVARIGDVGILSCYYTMHSNFICLIYALWLLLRKDGKRENPSVKGAVVVCILITGIVYHFLLNGAMEAGVGAVGEVTRMDLVANALVHYVVPLMTLLDYLLFTPKGFMSRTAPALWLFIPIAYVAFAMIRPGFSKTMFNGFSGKSRYPYPFLDVDLYGVDKVAAMVILILACILVLGFLLVALDFLLGKAARKKG